MQSANPRQGIEEKKKKRWKAEKRIHGLDIRNALFLSCAVVCIVLYIFRVIYSREGESVLYVQSREKEKKRVGYFGMI